MTSAETKTQFSSKGFTLIELIITLVVASILLGLVAPSFVDIIKNSRLTTQINELSASLNLSRSEAIKRGVNMTICSSSNKTSCDDSAWTNGWIVFHDQDSDETVDAGEDTIVLTKGALPSGLTLNYNGSDKFKIIHQSSGFSSSGFAGTFRLCDDRGDAYVKALVINFAGRISASSDVSGCS